MFGKALSSLLILAGGTYASSSVLQDVFEGITDMVSINAATAEMKMIHDKFTEFYIANNRYPHEHEFPRFFKEEFESPLEVVMTDPWMSEYWLLKPKVEIRCLGADKKPLTRDDLTVDYPHGRRPPASSSRSSGVRYR